jgi:hypothetical protein
MTKIKYPTNKNTICLDAVHCFEYKPAVVIVNNVGLINIGLNEKTPVYAYKGDIKNRKSVVSETTKFGLDPKKANFIVTLFNDNKIFHALVPFTMEKERITISGVEASTKTDEVVDFWWKENFETGKKKEPEKEESVENRLDKMEALVGMLVELNGGMDRVMANGILHLLKKACPDREIEVVHLNTGV